MKVGDSQVCFLKMHRLYECCGSPDPQKLYHGEFVLVPAPTGLYLFARQGRESAPILCILVVYEGLKAM